MEYDPKKITNVHHYLDIVSAFIEKVPVEELKDETWVKIQEQAKDAAEILGKILRPIPNGDDRCRSGPVLKIVDDYLSGRRDLE